MLASDRFLMGLHQIARLYRHACAPLCAATGLGPTELELLAFLANNPMLDTAQDMVRYRGFSKAHVSQAVDALLSRGLVARRVDAQDRRRIHLSLLPAAQPVVAQHRQVREQAAAQLFAGLSPEQLALWDRCLEQVFANADALYQASRLT